MCSPLENPKGFVTMAIIFFDPKNTINTVWLTLVEMDVLSFVQQKVHLVSKQNKLN